MEEAATQLERDHVHSVYEKIAPYFNDSRYKAWPKVRQFLFEQEPGSIVADVGCGNGKYLHINKNIFKLGCDVCRPLVDVAWSQGHEVQLCDGLRLPYRDGCFDAVLSIAVIHHLSTKERRIRAIKELTRTLRVGGHIMIYVWAMEQKRRKFEKQDIFVPWNPNSFPGFSRDAAKSRRATESQSLSDNIDNDNHRKVRSTSSVVDEEDVVCSKQQRSKRVWFFSRSLDSVLDFGSLAISRSSSRELCTLSTHMGETEESKPGRRARGGGLIRQVSNLFSLSRNSSEEDVFGSVTELHEALKESVDNSTTVEHAVSEAFVQECGSVPLPDLVSYQEEQADKRGMMKVDGGPQGEEQGQPSSSTPRLQENPELSEWNEEKMTASCLRYYHVFKEGELQELIQHHVEELHVLHTYFDHANWCVVAEKVQVWKI